MPTLSAILIVRNEAAHLHDCLTSLAFVDEIIVVDSGSQDDSVAIARSLGAQVEQTSDWPGFGPQKNRALARARCDWVLSIDADERVTDALAAEIRQAIETGDADAFSIPRRSSFCGQWVYHSGWWPDPVLRLFRRERARFSDDLVHERLLPDTTARVSQLQQPLLHYSYTSLEQVLDKVNSYSSAGARMALAQGRRSSLGKAVAHGLWAFVRTWVLRRGFLDGRAGLMIALMNGQASFYKYAKLYWLNQNRNAR